MGRKRKSQTLNIFTNGMFVGTLTKSSTNLVLEYDDEYMTSKDSRSVSMSLPHLIKRHTGDVVVNYFDNLLPDNIEIRKRIQKRYHIDSSDSFDLLYEIGRDCVGALQLVPESMGLPNVYQIDCTELDDKSIADLLDNHKSAPLGMSEDTDFRISIAGAQEKTALLKIDDVWCMPKGATPTSHIFKLPLGIINRKYDMSTSVENEWFCMMLLKELGLQTANVEIASFENKKVLIVERFDRLRSDNGKWIKRIPQEDFCQALGVSPAFKYESDGGPGIIQSMDLLKGSTFSVKDRTTFMKAVFIFWLLGAIDGHAKNFSIFHGLKGNYKLTPIYDVLSAYPLLKNRGISPQQMKMGMGLKGKNKHYHWDRIQYRHWLSTTKLCGFPGSDMENIIQSVLLQSESAIDNVYKILPDNFPESISESISEFFLKQCDFLIGQI